MRFPNGVELWLPQGDVALLTAAAPRRWSAKPARGDRCLQGIAAGRAAFAAAAVGQTA
jgi:hypothetical protein